MGDLLKILESSITNSTGKSNNSVRSTSSISINCDEAVAVCNNNGIRRNSRNFNPIRQLREIIDRMQKRFIETQRLTVKLTGAAIALIGLSILLDWIFGVGFTISFINGVVMKPPAAVSFIGTGAALYLLGTQNKSLIWAWVPPICMGILIVIASSSNFPAYFEQISPGQTVMYDGAPSVGTVIAFVFVIMGLLRATPTFKFDSKMLKIDSLCVLAIGVAAIIGHFSTDKYAWLYWHFYTSEKSYGISIYTALCFVLTGIGFYALSNSNSNENEI